MAVADHFAFGGEGSQIREPCNHDQVRVFRPRWGPEFGIKSYDLWSWDWKLFFKARKIATKEEDWKSPLGLNLFVPAFLKWLDCSAAQASGW